MIIISARDLFLICNVCQDVLLICNFESVLRVRDASCLVLIAYCVFLLCVCLRTSMVTFWFIPVVGLFFVLVVLFMVVSIQLLALLVLALFWVSLRAMVCVNLPYHVNSFCLGIICHHKIF